MVVGVIMLLQTKFLNPMQTLAHSRTFLDKSFDGLWLRGLKELIRGPKAFLVWVCHGFYFRMYASLFRTLSDHWSTRKGVKVYLRKDPFQTFLDTRK